MKRKPPSIIKTTGNANIIIRVGRDATITIRNAARVSKRKRAK